VERERRGGETESGERGPCPVLCGLDQRPIARREEDDRAELVVNTEQVTARRKPYGAG
jgi:hypothetical protein